MNLSISDLLAYLSCNYAGQTRMQEQAWSPETGALRIGKAIHKHMEWILKGRPGDPPLLTLQDDDDRKSLDAMLEAVSSWTPPWEVLAVEKQVHAKCGENTSDAFTIVGTLDGIVKDDRGRFWSVQWKSIGKGRNVGSELERVRMSPHEITYHWLAERDLGIPLSGTIVGLLRKGLSKKEVEMGVPIFQLYDLPRSPGEVYDAFTEDILPLFYSFNEAINSGTNAPRNWTACFGPFGNSPCPLFAHCHNQLPIEVCGLVPLEQRYDISD